MDLGRVVFIFYSPEGMHYSMEELKDGRIEILSEVWLGSLFISRS